MEEKNKLKNLKDLEYNNLLNKQNITLVLIGTALVTLIITDTLYLPFNISKLTLIIILVLGGMFSLSYFNRKLRFIMKEISEL